MMPVFRLTYHRELTVFILAHCGEPIIVGDVVRVNRTLFARHNGHLRTRYVLNTNGSNIPDPHVETDGETILAIRNAIKQQEQG